MDTTCLDTAATLTRREEVYAVLRDELRRGRLAPGQRLVEQALAKRLAVSRTPVREALFRLAQEGLLIARGRGYEVPALDARDVRELYEMRRLLEPQLARHAALSASHDQIVALGTAVERERAAAENGGLDAFVAANLDYRAALIACCPNRRLARTVELFADQIRAIMRLTLSPPENQALTADFHAQVYRGIRDRAPDRAASAAAELLFRAEDDFLRRFAGSRAATLGIQNSI